MGTSGTIATHERWFVDSHEGGDWGFATSPLVLTLLAAVIAVTLVWRLVALRLPTPELSMLRPLQRLTPWVPRLLGIHLGVALLALAATGGFLTPAVDPGDGLVASGLLLLEAAVGIWLITGVKLRQAACALVLTGPALAVLAGPMALLESANLVAVAGFLLVLPPGPDAHGAVNHDDAASTGHLRIALLVLRVGVATALVSLAFAEKLTNPQMARETLETYPRLDVFAWVGLEVAPDTFIAIAGAIEVLFGLLVLSGALPQVATLVAAVPFNMSLLLFGQTELIGHLPIYGVFLALLVYGSDPRTARLVRWLPRRRIVARRPVDPALQAGACTHAPHEPERERACRREESMRSSAM